MVLRRLAQQHLMAVTTGQLKHRFRVGVEQVITSCSEALSSDFTAAVTGQHSTSRCEISWCIFLWTACPFLAVLC